MYNLHTQYEEHLFLQNQIHNISKHDLTICFYHPYGFMVIDVENNTDT